MVGGTFGRYEIEEEIGRGGMGTVYRARDLKLNREVAIKVLRQDFLSLPTAWGYVLQEAQNASALNHPCICTIYDVGEEDAKPYIAMEYIDGQRLSSLLLPCGLPPALVIHYGRLIAGALAHAHERGILHRDIKSRNVIITAQGDLKILDFGFAKRLRTERVQADSSSVSSFRQDGRLPGTIQNMAPEVLRGERATVRSDIWSLGVVLYEMATGEHPFRGRTLFELTTAIMVASPAPLPERVPGPLARAIRRCLQNDPAKRYHRAREILKAMPMEQRASDKLDRELWLGKRGQAIVSSHVGRHSVRSHISSRHAQDHEGERDSPEGKALTGRTSGRGRPVN